MDRLSLALSLALILALAAPSHPAANSAYCYGQDRTSSGSCASILQTSVASQELPDGLLAAGNDVSVQIRFTWTVANRTVANSTILQNATTACNTTNCNVTGLSWFFPKVDVHTQLLLNGTQAVRLVSSSTRRWDQVWISVQIVVNGTLFSTELKQWFAQPDTASTSIFYIPYRGAVVQLDKGVIQSIFWEDVSKALSLCGSTLVDQLDICPVECTTAGSGSGGFLGCDIKVYLMWAGTDASGKNLRSVEQSAYRIQNIV
ncbi:hypothetical protein M427DRAFT_66721 [Gonapodya prolifera JEL478]|uniref:Uncharacterized protein n=1 Tax=Gonapodya prolifera (strain JEL478) TaxID=1344416 RepID=A0A139ATV3_GONPJ|nr:hypothetical protein M427DRAFT_66721 [Gonapodya prolifera JEL478]|eukprot:KXS20176.1 hypothetical protein M427DRAFT_66721 [Gonapodya prolifera JEL478]